jgi:hypothetical protein
MYLDPRLAPQLPTRLASDSPSRTRVDPFTGVVHSPNPRDYSQCLLVLVLETRQAICSAGPMQRGKGVRGVLILPRTKLLSTGDHEQATYVSDERCCCDPRIEPRTRRPRGQSGGLSATLLGPRQRPKVVGDHVLGLRTGVEAKRAVRESFSASRRAGQEMMDVSQARVVEMSIADCERLCDAAHWEGKGARSHAVTTLG